MARRVDQKIHADRGQVIVGQIGVLGRQVVLDLEVAQARLDDLLIELGVRGR